MSRHVACHSPHSPRYFPVSPNRWQALCNHAAKLNSPLRGSEHLPLHQFPFTETRFPKPHRPRASRLHGLKTVYRGIAVAFALLADNNFRRISQLTAACTELFDTPMLSAISW